VRGFGTIFRCGPSFHAIVMGTFSVQFGLLCAHQLEAAAESAE
jgi:hypothetical protein